MLPTDPANDPAAPSGAPNPASTQPTGPVDTYAYLQTPTALQAPPVPARRGSSMLAVALGVVAVLAGGALFMSGVLVGQRIDAQPGTPTSRADAFQPFWDTYEAIEDRYAGGDINQEALIRGAIRGMVEALEDPYSAYLTPEEYQSGLQDLSGQFEGIGAEIGTRSAAGETSECATLGPECILIVVAPLEGSPAKSAGLLAGDAILEVDGSGLDGLTVDDARDKVRGKKGTTVVLTIQRGTDAPFNVPIVRDTIVQREVIERDLAEGEIGYINVTGFSDNAASQFHDALKSDIDAGRKKIILDLRGNPGGYVTAARQIASEFIGTGPLFWEEDADGRQVQTDASSGGLATSDEIERRRPRRSRQRLGQRDRRGRAPGPAPGHARRRDDVRQGHRPAVDRAPGQRRAQAHDRQVADARQALDPPGRDRAGGRRGAAGAAQPGRGSRARQGGRDARGDRGRRPGRMTASTVRVGSIVIRVDDLEKQLAFWSAALDYVPRRGDADDFVLLKPRDGAGPNVSLDRVAAKVQVPPKIHLDLYTEDQAGEVARLLALGATEVHWDKKPADADYVILADPEGNRFCVVDLTR